MNFPDRLVLASQSSRRKAILRFTGIPFRSLRPKEVIERRNAGERPFEMAVRLALEKAQVIAKQVPKSLVLGADTVVACEGKVFGKPKNRKQAQEMILHLQGRSHLVWTGVALVGKNAGIIRCHIETTRVIFRRLEFQELENYLDTPEPYDKAGAYAIQGTARQWVEKWEGDYFNVMGLPIHWCVKEMNRIFNRSEMS